MAKNPEALFLTAVGDRHRMRILNLLIEKPMSVKTLSKSLKIEQSNLSHHLKCLFDCKFVDVNVKGRNRMYSINPSIKKIIAPFNSYIRDYGAYLKTCKESS